jgi:tRNA(Glu) U13 pseudouridine synthase TruD
MKMILCCNSCYKEDVIKNWFKKKLEIDIEIEKIDIINESLPRQPIGEDVKLICLKKINDVKDKYYNNTINFILSIENFLEIMEDKIKYRLCISVYKNNEYITEMNEGVNLDIEILNNYSKFLLIIKDLKNSYINTSNKYIFNGCEEKLVEIINRYYPDLPKYNSIKKLKNSKYNNKDQIEFLLDKLFI